MEALELPIDSGALYHDQIDDTYVRVRRVFVDEDMDVQLGVNHGLLSQDDGNQPNQSYDIFDLDTFVGRINDSELVRCNDDHEAWVYRFQRQSA